MLLRPTDQAHHTVKLLTRPLYPRAHYGTYTPTPKIWQPEILEPKTLNLEPGKPRRLRWWRFCWKPWSVPPRLNNSGPVNVRA